MSKHERHITAQEDRVSWHQLIAYGAGGLIPIFLFNAAWQIVNFLGNISLGLSLFWLGVVGVIPRLWDAISDPIMGHISDNTRSRWGRRRPYILIGGIAAALAFMAIWWVPRGDSIVALFPTEAAFNWFLLLYILGGLLVFYTTCTCFEIPHGALGMEMSADYHERTRLFSSKSFIGNLFAMSAGFLIPLATLEIFRGPGGDEIDGMRYVSMMIAGILIPMVFWWFFVLKEPGFTVAKEQKKSRFWKEMQTTLCNKTFLSLVIIIFTLAMGFNFVGGFANYITVFYLYGGDLAAAGPLLGITGTVWGFTSLLAVFPLNYMSARIGKNKSLLIAIMLMCGAQISKIYCYNPSQPFLILIPTVLLSAGMLMFFTLGASMVADVADEDALKTGTRSEGSYYSVYWWFIKMGTAFAGIITGILLTITYFDQQRTKNINHLSGSLEVIRADASAWIEGNTAMDVRILSLGEQVQEAASKFNEIKDYYVTALQDEPPITDATGISGWLATAGQGLSSAIHSVLQNVIQSFGDFPGREDNYKQLIQNLALFQLKLQELDQNKAALASDPNDLINEINKLLQESVQLRQQSPESLLLVRAFEIGLPLLLSIVSIILAVRYPLTEERCYEIKAALKARNESSEHRASAPTG